MAPATPSTRSPRSPYRKALPWRETMTLLQQARAREIWDLDVLGCIGPSPPNEQGPNAVRDERLAS